MADHGGSHLAPEAMAAYGESLAILERVVVAPAVGRFYPTELAGREAGSGTRIQCGQAIGQVASQRVSTPVCSPFESCLMGMLAVAGGARRPRPTGRLAAGPQRRVQRWMTTGRE